MVAEAHERELGPEEPSFHWIARQVVSGLSWTAVALLTSFATKVLLTRTMEPRELGLLLAAQSFAGLALAAASLGIPDAVTRHIGAEAGRDSAPRRTMYRAASIVGAATLVVSLLVLVGLWTWLRRSMAADALWATTIVVVSLPLLGVGDVIGAAHRGVNRLGAKLMLADVGRPMVVAVGLLVSPLLLTRTAPFVAALYALAALVSLVGLWIVFTRDPRWQNAGVTTSSDLLRFGLPIAGAAVLAGPLVNSGLPLMLSAWAGPAAVAYYTIALSLQAIVYLPIAVFEQSVIPTWARMVKLGRHQELSVSYGQYTNVCFAGATSLGLIVIANDTAILSLLFGPMYQASSLALKGTIAATLWGAMTGPNEAMLRAFGHAAAIFKARMASAVAGLAMGLQCIPPFGLAGAVAAFAVTAIVINTLYGITLYRGTRIHPLTWGHAMTTGFAVAGLVANATMSDTYPVTASITTTALAALVLIGNADLRMAVRTLVAH